MIDRSRVHYETTIAASPVWIRLRDTFTGAAPKGPVEVKLERETNTGWAPFEYPHRLGPDGDLAFVNLGRAREPGLVGTFRIRVTVSVGGSVTETPAGVAALVVPVAAWSPDAPARPNPVVIDLFPGPAYAFAPGTPVLAGRVTNQGTPVAAAAVEVRNGPVVVEAARTDDRGHFRLPLRWSSGPTVVHARTSCAPRSPTTTGKSAGRRSSRRGSWGPRRWRSISAAVRPPTARTRPTARSSRRCATSWAGTLPAGAAGIRAPRSSRPA